MIRKGWTTYAALLTGLVLAGEVANLAQGGRVDPRTFANWIVTGVLLTATWGYALQRRIGAQYYWRAACWVVIVATLVTTVPALLAGPAAILVVLVLLALLVPAFYASYRYAYRSPQIWPQQETAP